jgi:O6-methylguanine-DNA--protein-cysteine methyltransferase
MYTQTSNLQLAESGKGDVLIPLIRAAATIGFAIIRGTDLQIRVWEALQKVPAGAAANYTFLAEQIGAPNVP